MAKRLVRNGKNEGAYWDLIAQDEKELAAVKTKKQAIQYLHKQLDADGFSAIINRTADELIKKFGIKASIGCRVKLS